MHECMPVYIALHYQVSGACMALTRCVMNQRLIASLGPRLKPDIVRQYLYCLGISMVRVT